MEDKNARRIRIEQLKKNIKKNVTYGDLFNQCIDLLDVNSRIYSHEKSQKLVNKMVDEFPFTKWGRVDWESVPNKLSIKRTMELSVYQIELQQNYFIMWDQYNLPVIETTIGDIL
jgi:hypothetical protein